MESSRTISFSATRRMPSLWIHSVTNSSFSSDSCTGWEAGVVNYIVKPFREAELLPAIEIAMARYQEFLEMDHEVRDLKETLETRKLVERAKGLLMDQQGLKEAEAFRKIQQLSMNTRKSMKEIAQAILLANEI